MDFAPASTVAETRTGAVFSVGLDDGAATGGIVTEPDAAEGPAAARVGGNVREGTGGPGGAAGREKGGGRAASRAGAGAGSRSAAGVGGARAAAAGRGGAGAGAGRAAAGRTGGVVGTVPGEAALDPASPPPPYLVASDLKTRPVAAFRVSSTP